jgi:hypothetical protein
VCQREAVTRVGRKIKTKSDPRRTWQSLFCSGDNDPTSKESSHHRFKLVHKYRILLRKMLICVRYEALIATSMMIVSSWCSVANSNRR